MGEAADAYHIWRREVVQQCRDAALALGRNGDVQHSLAPIVRLLKREVSHVGPHTLLQHRDVEEVALAREATDATQQRLPPRPEALAPAGVAILRDDALGRERREVDPVALEHAGELLGRVHRHQRGDQRARRRPRDDARQQPAQEQRLDDPDVAQPEDGAALQHERAPPERLPRVVHKVQLHLVRQDALPAVPAAADACRRRRQGADVLDGLGDLRDVLLDEVLGAREGAVVELRRGEVAEVADEAGAEEVDELVEVVLLARDGEGAEALGDESPVVVLRRRVIPPVGVTIISF